MPVFTSPASIELDNLSLTAINTDLVFGPTLSGVVQTKATAIASTPTADIMLASGSQSASADSNTGNVTVQSGNCTVHGGTAGDVVLKSGLNSDGVTHGAIKLQNGSEGTSGQVWTSTDTLGTGSWQAAGGGGALTATSLTTEEAGSATTAVGGSASGVAPSVAVSGNSMAGQITYTAGAGAALGEQVVVTFGTAYMAAPLVMITAGNANASDSAGGFEGTYPIPSTGGFTINTLGSTGAVEFKWNYLVVSV